MINTDLFFSRVGRQLIPTEKRHAGYRVLSGGIFLSPHAPVLFGGSWGSGAQEPGFDPVSGPLRGLECGALRGSGPGA